MNNVSIDEGNAIQAEADAREDERREADEHDPVGAILRAIETIEREEKADGGPLPMGSPFWIRLRVASERGKSKHRRTNAGQGAAASAFIAKIAADGLTTSAALLAMTAEQAGDVFGLCPVHAAELVATLRQPLPPA